GALHFGFRICEPKPLLQRGAVRFRPPRSRAARPSIPPWRRSEAALERSAERRFRFVSDVVCHLQYFPVGGGKQACAELQPPSCEVCERRFAHELSESLGEQCA